MQRVIVSLSLILILFTAGCTSSSENWQRVDVEAFEASIESNPNALLLDVRTQTEWEQDGHLEDATLIPHSDLETRSDELPEDKDELILLYCRSGNRSQDAANTLLDLGYTNIIELKVGINGWKNADKPVLYGE